MPSQEPNIEFDENNIPINLDFGDSYYSKSGGLDETLEVFIKACKLPEKFQTQDTIIIGETGFGTGLNFLVTWQEWQRLRKSGAILHFYTFEKFLMNSQIAQMALSKWPQLDELAQKLIKKWPIAVSGNQRIWLDDQTALNIIIGDANQTMKTQEFLADAWFLDGFAPRTNEDFWNQEIFTQVARLIKPDGRIGTYTVAKIVRDGLEAAGFIYEKCQGFGSKRERLEAYPKVQAPHIQTPRPKNVAIIGGGIAGSTIAYALSKRQINCAIYDNDPKGEIKASNNARGLIMPRLDRNDNFEARFFRNAYLYAIRELEKFEGQGFNKCHVKEISKSKRDNDKYQKFAQQNPLNSELLEAGNDYLIHKGGGMGWPSILCQSLRNLTPLINADIQKISFNGEIWNLIDKSGNNFCADIVVLANGTRLNQFAKDIEIAGRLGQVSISDGEYLPQMPLGSSGYCLPLDEGFLFGATFDEVPLDAPLKVTEMAHLENLQVLSDFAPELAKSVDVEKLQGRTSMRTISNDMRPIAGLCYDETSVYVLGALGARGLSLSLILAEMIVCKITGEPIPFEKDIAKYVDPKRFIQSYK